MPTFGSRVRAALRAAGDGSPQQLATIGGFSVHTARKWLAMDIARVDAMNLARVALQLNVSIYWLIWGIGLVTGMGALKGYELRLLRLAEVLPAAQLEALIQRGEELARHKPCQL